MNVNCNIIRDLLPLYAEDMVSEDSKALVDDHLCGCDSCTKELAELKKAPKVPVEVETTSLRRVENAIRRRKLLTAATAALTVLAVLVTGIIFLMTPVYLTAQQAIEGVELRDDGGLAIDYAAGIMRYSSFSFIDQDEEFFQCHTTRYDWFRSRPFATKISKMTQEEQEEYVRKNALKGEAFQKAWDRIHNIHVEYGTWRVAGSDDDLTVTSSSKDFPENIEWVSRTAEEDVWYINPYNPSGNTLIWNGAQKNTDGIPSSIDGIYLVLLGGCVCLAVVLFLVTRNRKGGNWELLRCIAFLAASGAVSILLVTGGNLIVSGSVARYKWPSMIICESLVLTVTALMWWKLHQTNKA